MVYLYTHCNTMYGAFNVKLTFPTFYGIRQIIVAYAKASHITPSWARWIQQTFLTSNSILPFQPRRISKWSLPFLCSPTKITSFYMNIPRCVYYNRNTKAVYRQTQHFNATQQSGRWKDALNTSFHRPDCLWMHERNTIKLHVQVFLRTNTWMFETCRRRHNWIKTLMWKVRILLVLIT